MTVAEGVKQCYNSGSWIFYCRVGAFTKQSRTLKSLAETNLIVFEPGMGVRCAKSDVFVGGAVLGHSFSKVRCFIRGWGKAFALKSRMFFGRGRFAAFVCKVGWVFFGWEAGLGRWPKQISSNKSYQSSGPWKWTCQLVCNYRVVKINSPSPPPLSVTL